MRKLTELFLIRSRCWSCAEGHTARRFSERTNIAGCVSVRRQRGGAASGNGIDGMLACAPLVLERPPATPVMQDIQAEERSTRDEQDGGNMVQYMYPEYALALLELKTAHQSSVMANSHGTSIPLHLASSLRLSSFCPGALDGRTAVVFPCCLVRCVGRSR
ncbi:hypothetical protein K469DRAFT_44273 [Zopfia rhizophila CBS 207.26]|uniref:Uncharacterized protein n=1 Tax=Zopfia rhizophila CBS 207.26 TaxID=1314779 RepID=A0A6A6EHN8_9PEZI|nr:hypothetical protein K469DRAFT_44273 [Zopfia rhizophila CBS 207.26]